MAPGYWLLATALNIPGKYVFQIPACDISQAIDRLGWGASKKFSSTCMSTKEYFDKLLLGLENPATREAFAKAMDEHYKEVSLSIDFPGLEDATDFDHSAAGALQPSEKPSYIERQNAASTAQKTDSQIFYQVLMMIRTSILMWKMMTESPTLILMNLMWSLQRCMVTYTRQKIW